MSWTYVCPACGEQLNPNKTLILLGQQKSRKLLIGFHPEPGNYELYLPIDVDLEEGEAWNFYCPVCRADLKTDENENLCSVVMLEENLSRRVLFSRIAGEKATYVMYDQQLEHLHGRHSDAYVQHLVPIRDKPEKKTEADD